MYKLKQIRNLREESNVDTLLIRTLFPLFDSAAILANKATIKIHEHKHIKTRTNIYLVFL